MNRYWKFFVILLVVSAFVLCNSLPGNARVKRKRPKSNEKSGSKKDPIIDKWSLARYDYRRGTELYVEGRWLEAKEAFERAIEIMPEFSEALNAYGRVLQKLGRNVDAMYYYLLAVRFDDKLFLAYINMGDVARILGDDLAAESYYKKALTGHENPAAYDALGRVYTAMMIKADAKSKEAETAKLKRELEDRAIKHADDAIASYSLSLALEHKNPESLYAIIKLYYRRGKFESCWQSIVAYEKMGFEVPSELKQHVQEMMRRPTE